MSSADLSSIKWQADGEMSPQDTWSLVRKLTKAEEQDRASALLHLASKHSHSKTAPPPRAQIINASEPSGK